MRGDKIKTNVLSVQVIPNADEDLLNSINAEKGIKSLGIITTDCDDVSYAALDEATKKANVSVIYARSMYGGSTNASTLLAGEFIGILGADDPAEVRSGISAAVSYIKNDAFFYEANDDGSIVYYAQCISSCGSYLAECADVKVGTSLAYLISAPMEAICGIDAAIKAADVSMKVFYGPPSETNFAGALVSGDQAACKAACEAFKQRIIEIADNPLDIA